MRLSRSPIAFDQLVNELNHAPPELGAGGRFGRDKRLDRANGESCHPQSPPGYNYIDPIDRIAP